MITAKIGGVKKEKNKGIIEVHFYNNYNLSGEMKEELFFIEQITLERSMTMEKIKEVIARKIKDVEDLHNFIDSFSVGQVIDSPTTVVKTQEEIDQEDFIRDYNLYLRVKKAIDVGILTGNETPVVNLLNKVKDSFKPSYLTLL